MMTSNYQREYKHYIEQNEQTTAAVGRCAGHGCYGITSGQVGAGPGSMTTSAPTSSMPRNCPIMR